MASGFSANTGADSSKDSMPANTTRSAYRITMMSFHRPLVLGFKNDDNELVGKCQ
jgi:hypothetical protein